MLLNAQKLLERYILSGHQVLGGEEYSLFYLFEFSNSWIYCFHVFTFMSFHCITWDGKTMGPFVCFFILLRIRKKTPVLLSSTRKTLIIISDY